MNALVFSMERLLIRACETIFLFGENALLFHMAGMEKNIGLDVGYYCICCDKKTNLTIHVFNILYSFESIKVWATSIEKNLCQDLHVKHGIR